MAEGCCREYGCRRKSPILIRKGPFSGAWYAVTRYRSLGDHPGTVRTAEGGKHDITSDIEEIRADAKAEILDQVAAVIKAEMAKAGDPLWSTEADALYPGLEIAYEFIKRLAGEQGVDLRV